MEQKIIIIGAGGMLGHDLAEVFADHEPLLWDTDEIDITNAELVQQKLSEENPDIVINAAAYTNVDGAEENRDLAFAVNAEGPAYLAQTCKSIGAVLVHYSTEYVFNGKNENGYTEDEPVSPVNVYGESKAAGEQNIKDNCSDYYIIRTSWLYGRAPQKGKPRGLNFVETMLQLARDGKDIKVVNDQFGKPTYTKDLAVATREILEQKPAFGIYHRTNDGVCSWYEFAQAIFDISGMQVNLTGIPSSEYPMKTPRPQYSTLQNTKLSALRSWREALDDYLN